LKLPSENLHGVDVIIVFIKKEKRSSTSAGSAAFQLNFEWRNKVHKIVIVSALYALKFNYM
jgi:hypothetical protein